MKQNIKNGDYPTICELRNKKCIISVNNIRAPFGGTFPEYSCTYSVNGECDEKTCICNVGGTQKYFRID